MCCVRAIDCIVTLLYRNRESRLMLFFLVAVKGQVGLSLHFHVVIHEYILCVLCVCFSFVPYFIGVLSAQFKIELFGLTRKGSESLDGCFKLKALY